MARLRIAAALATVLATAFVGTALASAVKVTGGSATVTPSSAATSLLSSNGITVTPVAPASLASGTFTFPILRGRFDKHLRGVIIEQGGLVLSNGTHSVTIRHLTIDSDRRGVSIDGLVAQRGVVRVARVTGVAVSGTTATGTVHVTAITAAAVNRLAGKHVVGAGAVLGTASITPTLAH
jgi:hypothetical protein